MSAHNEAKVYIRIKPTAQFAQELIEYLPDKQVHKQGLLFNIPSIQHITSLFHDQNWKYCCISF